MSEQYWDSFYTKNDLKISYPSQFAVFTLGEILPSGIKADILIEFGCGNGRDINFLHEYFPKSYALDGSYQTIKNNTETIPQVCFDVVNFNNKQEIDKFISHTGLSNKTIAIYSRFSSMQ